jgi:hypothetical protein
MTPTAHKLGVWDAAFETLAWASRRRRTCSRYDDRAGAPRCSRRKRGIKIKKRSGGGWRFAPPRTASLRQLKALKFTANHQFIFATHNANFPVLGDAECLGACDAALKELKC